MDNRVFNINGSGEETLADVLGMALRQSGWSGFEGWKVCDKGLILTWHLEKDTNRFPAEKLTAKQVTPIVWEWLNSKEAAQIKLEGWDVDCDHDGDNSRGWRVFCEDWGQVHGCHYAVCCITPAYMWHGK